MSNNQQSGWSTFRMLCALLGGRNRQVSTEVTAKQMLPQLFDMAQAQDLLPALAVRCEEYQIDRRVLGEQQQSALTQALLDNTKRNMQISAQALKITRKLNQAGITPLFLKGTIQLLDPVTRNLGFRKQVDIDLIVEPAQLEAAAEVLLGHGYNFYEFPADPSSKPTRIANTNTAISRSATHHHLPALVKEGYVTTVELHRHFLPKRFQRKNPLQPLFSTALEQQNHSANFLIPSAEYQLIHLLLGKVIHDGYLAGRTFPIREACDYLSIVENKKEDFNRELVARHCGKAYPIFSQLVANLMMQKTGGPHITKGHITRRLQTMQKRYNSPRLAQMLDTHARVLHLAYSMLHSPGKLPTYLNRFK